MIRRVRGALVVAAAWAITWGVVGVGIGLIKWFRNDLSDVSPVSLPIAATLILSLAGWFAVAGAINGLMFALVVAFMERRQSVASISLARFALWGAVATLIAPILAVIVLVAIIGPAGGFVSFEGIAESAGLGMASAAAVLLLARRAQSPVDGPAA